MSNGFTSLEMIRAKYFWVARLKLKAHTSGQVYIGFLTGAVVMFLVFSVVS